jgi:hypothetical protein
LKLNTVNLDELFRNNVRTLANYLYVLRGCRKGHDFENWTEAEKQLAEYLSPDDMEPKSQAQNDLN